MKSVTFWSEGTRLAGDLYSPPDLDPGDRRPAVVLCHGWGGTKAHLAATGLPQRLAAAGYVVLAFDYRGWGDSESKVVVLDPLPKERTETSARVRVIREVVDPFDEAWDIRHAIDFIQGEPGVDPARIGLWGSSYGGGLVVWMAAHDERVRCVVSQVAPQDSRALGQTQAGAAAREAMRALATRQARGEAEPVPQDVEGAPGLRGTPHLAKMQYFAPIEFAEQIAVPVLLIDAEHEELFDRHQHSEALSNRMIAAGKASVRYVVVPGISHYAIYGEKAEESARLAIEWFDAHLGAAVG
ncbi:MAG: alpha/beta fold hydrolase [Chloroflexi bacterium]|nr:alpha/beta fold hydrolase [Chloroflexota bacterium]